MTVDRRNDLHRHAIRPLVAVLAAGAIVAVAARADEPARRVPVHEGKAKANGITIAYESYGPEDREAILMIMGHGAQLTAWPVELCEELVKRGYRVIIFDNRDVGLSTHFDEAGKPDMEAVFKAKAEGKPVPVAYTLDDMAKDAVGLLDALKIKKAHIVGVSMGGMIAQLVAADHPEHTLSLTSIMSTTGNPAIPLPAKPDVMAKAPKPDPDGDTEAIIANAIALNRLLAGPKYPPDEKRIRELVLRTMKRSDDRAGTARQLAAVALGFYEDRRPKLKTIRVPTVVVHGAEDPLMSVEGGKDTAANIPGAELRILPDMGHDLPIPLVKDFADAITSAARRATGARASK
jgi:pimeloyl-ACP methyl ester carboxylesterase